MKETGFAEPSMVTVGGKSIDNLEKIEDETIKLDYGTFKNKYFYRCRLVYGGGAPPVFRDVVFDQCGFLFEGPADHTLSFLRMMYEGDPNLVLQAIGALDADARSSE